ncbi:homoserine dehydrogenase [Lachancea thermotolerans CBS 6340]|uniref:Homoserine dehydrogenase n=1 Tax=Lachancea thermotolerans (strain ATCC 56472 / CBS 6340 / NRRL Y-8284) TaxID=559295 RepID=C5DFS1_LACTC|nr:KLTH0D17446p [Lachancea thermotolerans CBS 6340]CAR23026.1 KLTH0D17446p [Lachancea thermotolerans CBS 6340]
MASKSVNLAVIGAGVVGSSFLKQVSGVKSNISYNLILIATSDNFLISRDYKPLSLSTWESDLTSSKDSPLPLEGILEYLKKSSSPVIFVDNTSNQTIAEFYPQLVQNGISIATPNKKGFSSDLSLWNKIFQEGPNAGLVYHEATVGAGLPIIGPLRDMVQTGDKIVKIEGIFSGSLSFILNEFSTISGNDSKFSDIVKVAKNLGYTEPDPRDDLNGLDVARKVTILARIAGFKVESPSSFPVKSLIPKPLESVASGKEYLEKLPAYDHEMDELKKEAAAENKVLRFVGKVDFPNNTVSVAMEKYDFSHPFASLKGSDNVISIQTERYTQPVIVQGAGAGSEVTAAGVLADVFRIAERI